MQANFPAAQIDRFCNLVRFMDLLQHTVDTDRIFPRIQVAKPAFRLPPPAAVPPKVQLLHLPAVLCSICCKKAAHSN